MKSRVRLEKYINFSLISNCIIFNTLAGCGKGKDKKGGGGCSGSGKDKDPVIIGEGKNEQSAEELAKKQKEEEERKKKEQEDKEKAEKLAKDKAALDKKRKELITKLKGLIKEINDVINIYEDKDLHIDVNNLVTEKMILDSDATQFVKHQTSVEELSTEVNDRKNSIKQRNIVKNKIKSEFNPKFLTLIEQVKAINDPDKYGIKINSDDIITQAQINGCKFDEIETITDKLNNLEKEIKTKFEEIKKQLKTKLTELENLIKDSKKNLLKLTCEIKDSDIDGINLDGINDIKKLNEIFRKIDELFKIIKLSPKEFADYLEKFLKERVCLFKFLGEKKDTCFGDLEGYKKNVETLINGLKSDEEYIKNNGTLSKKAIVDYNNFNNKLEEKVEEYNKKYIDKLAEIITKNNKLEINLNYSEKTINELTESEVINEYYKHIVNFKCEIKEEDIKKEISVDYVKSTDDLVKIEDEVLKKLEDQVNNQEKQFIKDIKNTFNFLQSSYKSLSNDINNAKLDNTNVDTFKTSLNILFNHVKTGVSSIFKDAKEVGTGGESMSSDLKDKLTKLGLYNDDEDKISTLNASLLEFSKYFDNNHKDNTIDEKLINLRKEINKNNIVEQRKKIYNRLKNFIKKYSDDIETTFLLNSKGIYITPYCFNFNILKCTIKEINIFTDNTGSYFYKKIDLKDFDNITFDEISSILNKFEYVVNINGKFLLDLKNYFYKNIKNISNLKFNFGDSLSGSCKDFLNDLDILLKVDLNKYFDNYLNFESYGKIYLTKHFKLSDFESIISNVVDSLGKINESFLYDLYFSKDDNYCTLKELFTCVEIYKLYMYQLFLVYQQKTFNFNIFIGSKKIQNVLYNTAYLSEGKVINLKEKNIYTLFFIEKGRTYHNAKYTVDKGVELYIASDGKNFKNLKDVFKNYPVNIIKTIESKDYIDFENFNKILYDNLNDFFECELLDKTVFNYKKD